MSGGPWSETGSATWNETCRRRIWSDGHFGRHGVSDLSFFNKDYSAKSRQRHQNYEESYQQCVVICSCRVLDRPPSQSNHTNAWTRDAGAAGRGDTGEPCDTPAAGPTAAPAPAPAAAAAPAAAPAAGAARVVNDADAASVQLRVVQLVHGVFHVRVARELDHTDG